MGGAVDTTRKALLDILDLFVECWLWRLYLSVFLFFVFYFVYTFGYTFSARVNNGILTFNASVMAFSTDILARSCAGGGVFLQQAYRPLGNESLADQTRLTRIPSSLPFQLSQLRSPRISACKSLLKQLVTQRIIFRQLQGTTAPSFSVFCRNGLGLSTSLPNDLYPLCHKALSGQRTFFKLSTIVYLWVEYPTHFPGYPTNQTPTSSIKLTRKHQAKTFLPVRGSPRLTGLIWIKDEKKPAKGGAGFAQYHVMQSGGHHPSPIQNSRTLHPFTTFYG